MPMPTLTPDQAERVARASRRYLPMSDAKLGRRFVALAAKIAQAEPPRPRPIDLVARGDFAQRVELAQREAFGQTVGDRFE